MEIVSGFIGAFLFFSYRENAMAIDYLLPINTLQKISLKEVILSRRFEKELRLFQSMDDYNKTIVTDLHSFFSQNKNPNNLPQKNKEFVKTVQKMASNELKRRLGYCNIAGLLLTSNSDLVAIYEARINKAYEKICVVNTHVKHCADKNEALDNKIITKGFKEQEVLRKVSRRELNLSPLADLFESERTITGKIKILTSKLSPGNKKKLADYIVKNHSENRGKNFQENIRIFQKETIETVVKLLQGGRDDIENLSQLFKEALFSEESVYFLVKSLENPIIKDTVSILTTILVLLNSIHQEELSRKWKNRIIGLKLKILDIINPIETSILKAIRNEFPIYTKLSSAPRNKIVRNAGKIVKIEKKRFASLLKIDKAYYKKIKIQPFFLISEETKTYSFDGDRGITFEEYKTVAKQYKLHELYSLIYFYQKFSNDSALNEGTQPEHKQISTSKERREFLANECKTKALNYFNEFYSENQINNESTLFKLLTKFAGS